MVNKDLLVARLDKLKGYVDFLESAKTHDQAQFAQDPYIMEPAKDSCAYHFDLLLFDNVQSPDLLEYIRTAGKTIYRRTSMLHR